MKREYKDGKLVKGTASVVTHPVMTTLGAMESIVALLNQKEWESEDLETVAEFCRLAGYKIRPPMTWHDCPNCGGHPEDEAT